jgi:ribosomal protein L40E
MVKKAFPEVVQRLYNRVFVCRKCKSKIRADYMKVKSGKVKCRKCGSRYLRPKRKEKKV